MGREITRSSNSKTLTFFILSFLDFKALNDLFLIFVRNQTVKKDTHWRLITSVHTWTSSIFVTLCYILLHCVGDWKMEKSFLLPLERTSPYRSGLSIFIAISN